jgi:hypothetical protein
MGNNTGNPGFTLWGTYKYKKWESGASGINKVYGYAAKDMGGVSGGQFVKIGGGAYLPPLRAYLEYRGDGLAKNLRITERTLNFPKQSRFASLTATVPCPSAS